MLQWYWCNESKSEGLTLNVAVDFELGTAEALPCDAVLRCAAWAAVSLKPLCSWLLAQKSSFPISHPATWSKPRHAERTGTFRAEAGTFSGGVSSEATGTTASDLCRPGRRRIHQNVPSAEVRLDLLQATRDSQSVCQGSRYLTWCCVAVGHW